MSSKIKVRDIFALSFGIILLVAWQGRLWITKELMFTHDSVLWYGIFSYFSDCLHNGFLPLWNPYMNSGEPFFLNIPILRLWDPSTLFLVLIGKFLKINLFTLYHYDLLLRYLIFICGCYFFFRHIAEYRINAFIAFITISFSSLSVSYLRQHAFVLFIYLLPWILLFIFKFLEQKKSAYLIGAAFLLGIVLPAHSSMFILSFISILLLSLFLTRGLPYPAPQLFLGNGKASILAILIFVFLSLMIVPLGSMFKQDIIPVVRTEDVPWAAYCHPADFLGLLLPYYFLCHFLHIVPIELTPEMSESFLYIGLLPLLFLMIGLFFSRQRYKFGFIITTLITGILMLGDKTPVYNLFIKYFPLFFVIRNMHSFGPFFLFCLCYFVCIGSEVVYETLFIAKREFLKNFFKLLFLFLILSIFLSIVLLTYHLNKLIPSIVCSIRSDSNIVAMQTDKLQFIRYSGPIRSIVNLVFFTLSSSILFFIFKKQKINFKLKYALLVSFILIDLISFDYALYRYVTYPRAKDNFELPPLATRFVYRDSRIPKIQIRIPFTAFVPVIVKEFTAYNEPWAGKKNYAEMKKNYYDFLRSPPVTGTHFFETKDYYKFRTSQIPNDVTNIWTGISLPKLRLISKGIVLPPEYNISELRKIDAETAKNVVFITGDLPQKYTHLKTTFEEINKQNKELGKIEVKDFNPNEIVLDVHPKQDCFLYYSDGYDRSWRIFIDGEEDKVYKANLAFKAVIVPQGKHKVHFLYDPKFYRLSLFCYFAGLLSIVVISIKKMWPHFKRKKSQYEKSIKK